MLRRNEGSEGDRNLLIVLYWFYLPTYWKHLFAQELGNAPQAEPELHIVVFFRRPWTFVQHNGTLTSAPKGIRTITYKP